MIYRLATPEIITDLALFPAVALLGPRQVGKTTLAKSFQHHAEKPTIYLDLEWAEDLQKLDDAGTWLTQNEEKCIIIDEIQLMPRLFPLLRSLIDRRREVGRFILLGSASPTLIRDSAESLAGRIAYHELTPFQLLETEGYGNMRNHWFRGGFPQSFLAENDAFALRWTAQFFTTYIERDLSRMSGRELNGLNLMRLVRMLAQLHGQLLNVQMLSVNLGIATQTINQYIALLEGSFLISRLEPYFVNVSKRLIRSPKLYFRDSGFWHSIIRIRDRAELWNSPQIGAAWEGYAIEEIRRVAGKSAQLFFYRTQNGAEVDLVLLTERGKIACIELKYSNTPTISKGFFISCEDLKPDFRFVIVPETERFERADGIIVCNLIHFLKAELAQF